jgi:hypothetical protein
LDDSHALFELDQNHLTKIVFGGKGDWIRVPSLSLWIEMDESKIDPYNAYILRSSCLSQLADLSRIAWLPTSTNSFIRPVDCERLFAFPSKFGHFCDLSYDHFPLFDLIPGIEVLSFNVQFQFASF